MKKILCSMCVMALSLMIARAEDKKDAAEQTTTIAAGGTLMNGNNDQFVGNASITHEGKCEAGSMRLGGEINYSEISGDTTNESWKLFGNFTHNLNERLYAVLNAQYFHDRTAEVEYRWTVSPGLGYYLMKREEVTLGVEAGPAYVWEKVGGVEDDFAAARIAERYDRTLSKTSKCWQSLEYLPRIDDWGDYILNFEIGAEAVLSGPVSLRLVVQDVYDSTPAEDKKENDVKAIGAVVYTL